MKSHRKHWEIKREEKTASYSGSMKWIIGKEKGKGIGKGIGKGKKGIMHEMAEFKIRRRRRKLHQEKKKHQKNNNNAEKSQIWDKKCIETNIYIERRRSAEIWKYIKNLTTKKREVMLFPTIKNGLLQEFINKGEI